MNTRSLAKTFIILLAVPFSAAGAVWLLYLLGYNMSIGVWVGLIALMGVDAETGVFMLLYLDIAYEEARREGRLRSAGDLRDAIMHGAVKRIRPKFMTVAVMFMGLVPITLSIRDRNDAPRHVPAGIQRPGPHVPRLAGPVVGDWRVSDDQHVDCLDPIERARSVGKRRAGLLRRDRFKGGPHTDPDRRPRRRRYTQASASRHEYQR
jgi:hypothetical protein